MEMTGEDKDGKKATQFRCPVEPCAGIGEIPHEDQARLPDEQTPGTLQAGQSAKGDEKMTSRNPNVIVVEQWLCLLLGLVCMVCGILGMCLKYSQVPSSPYIPWLGSAFGPILRLTAISCFALGAVLVRLGLARPNQSSISVGQSFLRSDRGNLAPSSNVFPAQRRILGIGWKWKGNH
jgi:hypothetical protein